MSKSNDNKNHQESITFEEIEGDENTFKAKVVRNGKVHEISVYAIPEDEFEKTNELYKQSELVSLSE